MSEEKKEMKKSSSPAKDLTVGSPMKLILGFAFPMFLGLLFQQFYSLVDTMIVGKYLGVDPFAGVGSTGSLNFVWDFAVDSRFRSHRALVPRIFRCCGRW